MPLRRRVWTAGKIVLLAGALVSTYILFAAATMRLALRAREVQVPDLTNHTANEATAIAGNLGLTVRVDETRRPNPKVVAGRVLAQEPGAGAIARRPRSIKVWLSAGPVTATVPQLIGQTERTAQLRLLQEGLAVAAIAEIRSQDYPADVVVAQTPPATNAAARVALLINRGEQRIAYVMPDLIGVNGDRAAEVLRARGFRVAVAGSNPYPGVAAGTVLRQSPQAGFQIALGEPIAIEVSR
jgi:beta-lactam-binding protein with PASTA domain